MGKIKLEGAIDLHCHYGPDFIQRPDFVQKHGQNHRHSVTALESVRRRASRLP